MKALEQAKLRRGAVLDAHMGVIALDVALEVPRNKARAVVGDQKRHLRQWPVQALGLSPGPIHSSRDVLGAIARREVARQQVARVVVDDRHRVPPAMPRNV